MILINRLMILIRRNSVRVTVIFFAQLIALFYCEHLFSGNMFAVQRALDASLTKSGMAAEQVNAITLALSLAESHISNFFLLVGLFFIFANLFISNTRAESPQPMRKDLVPSATQERLVQNHRSDLSC